MAVVNLQRAEKLTHADCGGRVEIIMVTDGAYSLHKCDKCGEQEYKKRFEYEKRNTN